jgi:hypothetical protein
MRRMAVAYRKAVIRFTDLQQLLLQIFQLLGLSDTLVRSRGALAPQ